MTLLQFLYLLGLPFAFLLTFEMFRIHRESESFFDFKYKKDDLFFIIIFTILFTSLSWLTVIISCIYIYIHKNADKILEILNSEKSIFDIIKEKIKK